MPAARGPVEPSHSCSVSCPAPIGVCFLLFALEDWGTGPPKSTSRHIITAHRANQTLPADRQSDCRHRRCDWTGHGLPLCTLPPILPFPVVFAIFALFQFCMHRRAYSLVSRATPMHPGGEPTVQCTVCAVVLLRVVSPPVIQLTPKFPFFSRSN